MYMYLHVYRCIIMSLVYNFYSSVSSKNCTPRAISYMHGIFYVFMQFFDGDSDGIVSEADISNRLPFKCFPHTEEHVVSGQQEGGGSESHDQSHDADEAAGHVASSQQEGGGSESHDQSHDADEAADIKGMSLGEKERCYPY